MNVELRIERLVLSGVPLPPDGGAGVAAEFSGEITRLIEAGGLAPALLGGTTTPRLTAMLGAGSLGRELAQSVYSCLGRS